MLGSQAFKYLIKLDSVESFLRYVGKFVTGFEPRTLRLFVQSPSFEIYKPRGLFSGLHGNNNNNNNDDDDDNDNDNNKNNNVGNNDNSNNKCLAFADMCLE